MEVDQEQRVNIFNVYNDNAVIDGAFAWIEMNIADMAVSQEEYDTLGYDQFKFKNIQ